MTQEQIKRTQQALAETRRHLNRELTYYSPATQKQNMIDFYRAHITKLEDMLDREPRAHSGR